jgi:WD40 repeat protein
MTVGRILANDIDKGSGFALATSPSRTTRVVLTAKHVVGDQEPASLQFFTEDERRIPVEHMDWDNDLDVAVLYLSEDVAGGLVTGRAVEGRSWEAETQPRPNDPKLYGTITDIHRRFVKQDGGREIYVLQLYEEQNLGDYKGYSGSPVVLKSSTDAVIGILIEQLRSRLSVPTSQPRPSTNVLYAIPIQDVLGWLASLGVDLRPADQCPYRSLEAFTKNDADLFFGRERVLDELIESLRHEPRFLAVLGPSGCGKSSLVQAGLLPLLEKEAVFGSTRWEIIITRPTNSTFTNIATSLQGAQQHVGLIIDQFEELFTAYPEEKCQGMVALLIQLLEESPRIHLILTLRNDFYSHFVQFEALVKWLKRGMVNVSPLLQRDEMRDIIQKPAEVAHLHFADGLAEIIVNDTLAIHSSSGTRGPGAPNTVLPLLEFALTQLWERRDKDQGKLTLAAYRTIGGVIGGLKQWADEVYYALSETERELARRIFTQLVYVNDETRHIPDSRRRRPKDELIRGTKGEQEMVEQVIQRLITARLLMPSPDTHHEAGEHNTEGTVEIIHDALLREWNELKGWLGEDPRFLIWRQEIERRTLAWGKSKSLDDPMKRDEGILLRGGELAEARVWLEKHRQDIGEAEQVFIQASQERDAKEQQRWKELYEKAERQRQIAFARQLAAQAELTQNRYFQDPVEYPSYLEQGILLAIESLQRYPSVEADETLRRGTKFIRKRYRLLPHAGRVVNIAFTPDGYHLAIAYADKSKQVYLWDISTDSQPVLLPHKDRVDAWIFNSNGKFLAITSSDNAVDLWDVNTGQRLFTFPHQSLVATALSPNGDLLATTSRDHTTILWDANTGEQLASLSEDFSDTLIEKMVFSPDGQFLACATDDKSVELWDVVRNIELSKVNPRSYPRVDFSSVVRDGVTAMMFSPNGRFLIVTGHRFGSVLDTKEMEWIGQLPSIPFGGRALSFHPGGQILAVGGYGGVLLYDITDEPSLLAVLPHGNNAIEAIAFSPNKSLIACVDTGGNVSLWEVNSSCLTTTILAESVDRVTFSSDGRFLATSGLNALLWNANTYAPIATMALEKHGIRTSSDLNYEEKIVFSPDNHSLAFTRHNIVSLWDTLSSYSLIKTFPHISGVNDFSFSPDGCYLATASLDRVGTLWEVSSGNKLAELPHEYIVKAVAFSRDGRFVATASLDRTAKLWEVPSGRQLDIFTHQDSSTLNYNKPQGMTDVAFHPKINNMLATADEDGIVILWDISRHQQLAILPHGEYISKIAFSPNGQFLATAGECGTAVLWEIPNGHRLTTLYHEKEVVTVAFSSNSHFLTTASADQTARVWEIPSGREISRIYHKDMVADAVFSPDSRVLVTATSLGRECCTWLWLPEDLIAKTQSYLTRNLTQDEWKHYMGDEPYQKTCPNLP